MIFFQESAFYSSFVSSLASHKISETTWRNVRDGADKTFEADKTF